LTTVKESSLGFFEHRAAAARDLDPFVSAVPCCTAMSAVPRQSSPPQGATKEASHDGKDVSSRWRRPYGRHQRL